MRYAFLLPTLLAGCSMASKFTTGGTSTGGPASSSADGNAVVPDVAGLTEAEARQRIADAGFSGTVEVVTNYTCDDSVPDRRACSTSPAVGAHMGRRLPITIHIQDNPERGEVGTDREWVKMPNVIGLPVDQAVKVLAKDGMTVIRWEQYESAAPCDAGVICAQNPDPGSRSIIRYSKQLWVMEPPSDAPAEDSADE